MFSYQVHIYEKQNNTWGWYNLTGWTRPFTDGTRLDETLDSGTLNLSCVPRQKAIKPFTRLRFIVSENGTEKGRIYRLVASARKTKRRYYGTPLYDWTINTIELTKLLERRLIDTMTVTKYINEVFNDSKYDAPYVWELYITSTANSMSIPSENCYKTPQLQGTTIDIYNPINQIAVEDAEYRSGDNPTGEIASVVITAPNGEKTTISVANTETNRVVGTYNLTQTGAYTIRANIKNATFRGTGIHFADRYTVTGSYTFALSAYNADTNPLPQQTISSVCKRLLSANDKTKEHRNARVCARSDVRCRVQQRPCSRVFFH